MKKLILFIGIVCMISLIFLVSFAGAPDSQAQPEVFTVLPGQEEKTITRLAEGGFIKNIHAFQTLLAMRGVINIPSGGYMISKSMDAWNLAGTMAAGPTLKWITIPEGMRKEQIGELLADALGWPEDELQKWNTTYTATSPDYIEGVYFPDTYLIPLDESGLDVAKRMQNRFNKQFEPYLAQFAEQDIIWTSGLKLASIIQREAAGPHDMPLIAGVLWNRLLKGQRLEIDATVQYARGKTAAGWWAPPSPQDIRTIDSPYNTYKYAGLPPHPISNPGIAAIEAVLNPEETDCIFYLHDRDKKIHCAVSYEEHLENIERYLR